MLAATVCATTVGVGSQQVIIECDYSNGLPGIVIVGLGNKAVEESKERIRSAIRNSNLQLPPKRYTLNLAPADIPKTGTGFDLAMAIAMLASSGQIDISLLKDVGFCAELGLNGALRPINGVLAITIELARQGIKKVFVSPENAPEAALVKNISVIPATNLKAVYRHLIDEVRLSSQPHTPVASKKNTVYQLPLISGQEQAKRALQIAAAGGHNVLMNGPPGSGKTMLAKAMVELMPELSYEEIIDVTLVHSIAGENNYEIVSTRPFRSPHHSSSQVALIGGGHTPQPGEISLSNHGILFLDELPEYPRSVIEALRQPLEDRKVSISRANSKVEFPAKFILVATQNPCPCGFMTDPRRECTCSAADISRYGKKISGPLLDRFDITIEVSRIDNSRLIHNNNNDPTDYNSLVHKIINARKIQQERYRSNTKLNAHITNEDLKRHTKLDAKTKQLLDTSTDKLQMSARGYIRTVKLARTIADLDSRESINSEDIIEAIQYRQRKQDTL